MNELIVALWFLSIVPLVLLAGRATRGLPVVRRWWLLVWFVLSGWLGLFFVAGAFVRVSGETPATSANISMLLVGALLCSPLAWGLWRRRAVDAAGSSRPAVAPDDDDNAAHPVSHSIAQHIAASNDAAVSMARGDDRAPPSALQVATWRFSARDESGDVREEWRVRFTHHYRHLGDVFFVGQVPGSDCAHTFNSEALPKMLANAETGELTSPYLLQLALPEVTPMWARPSETSHIGAPPKPAKSSSRRRRKPTPSDLSAHEVGPVFYFDYTTYDGDSSSREVSFTSFSRYDGAVYLNGRDHDRGGAARSFKASRVAGKFTDAATGEIVSLRKLMRDLPETQPSFGARYDDW